GLRGRHPLDPPRHRRHGLVGREQALDAQGPHRLTHLHPHRAGAGDGGEGEIAAIASERRGVRYAENSLDAGGFPDANLNMRLLVETGRRVDGFAFSEQCAYSVKCWPAGLVVEHVKILNHRTVELPVEAVAAALILRQARSVLSC